MAAAACCSRADPTHQSHRIPSTIDATANPSVRTGCGTYRQGCGVGFSRTKQWIWLGADLGQIAAVTIVVVVTRIYGMLSSLVFGLIVLPLAAGAFKRDREHAERAYRLNQHIAG